jgi:hypothetical protein
MQFFDAIQVLAGARVSDEFGHAPAAIDMLKRLHGSILVQIGIPHRRNEPSFMQR